MRLCPYHENSLGWDECTEGFKGCQVEEAREKATEEAEMEENKVICPVCSHVITDFNEGVSDPCKHVICSYVDMLNGEFVHVGDSTEAKEIADNILEQYEYLSENDADESLDELMQAFADEDGGYEVIELTTSGLACGPVSSTEYHLIKKG